MDEEEDGYCTGNTTRARPPGAAATGTTTGTSSSPQRGAREDVVESRPRGPDAAHQRDEVRLLIVGTGERSASHVGWWAPDVTEEDARKAKRRLKLQARNQPVEEEVPPDADTLAKLEAQICLEQVDKAFAAYVAEHQLWHVAAAGSWHPDITVADTTNVESDEEPWAYLRVDEIPEEYRWLLYSEAEWHDLDAFVETSKGTVLSKLTTREKLFAKVAQLTNATAISSYETVDMFLLPPSTGHCETFVKTANEKAMAHAKLDQHQRQPPVFAGHTRDNFQTFLLARAGGRGGEVEAAKIQPFDVIWFCGVTNPHYLVPDRGADAVPSRSEFLRALQKVLAVDGFVVYSDGFERMTSVASCNAALVAPASGDESDADVDQAPPEQVDKLSSMGFRKNLDRLEPLLKRRSAYEYADAAEKVCWFLRFLEEEPNDEGIYRLDRMRGGEKGKSCSLRPRGCCSRARREIAWLITMVKLFLVVLLRRKKKSLTKLLLFSVATLVSIVAILVAQLLRRRSTDTVSDTNLHAINENF
ncbi:unnamed protein product [Amoebophrya sp. A120]|nr:unnamed protein product [Amoebophrya sp. A120]|eukprot:GSA120T00011902001.1